MSCVTHPELKEAMAEKRSSCDVRLKRTKRKGGMGMQMMHRGQRGHRGEIEAIR